MSSTIRVFSGGYAGLYKSLDGGDTFSLAHNINAGYGCLSGVARRASDGRIFICYGTAYNQGSPWGIAPGSPSNIFYSDDEGSTWHACTQINDALLSLCVAPDGSVWIGGEHNVYHSADNGTTWQTPASSPLYYVTTVLALSSSIILAAGQTSNSGQAYTVILRSTNSGVNWATPGQEGSSPAPDFGTYSLSQDPVSGNLFRYNAISSPGLAEVSTDEGATWRLVTPAGAAGGFTSGGYVPGAMLLYEVYAATLLRSTDGGGAWSAVAGAPAALTGAVRGLTDRAFALSTSGSTNYALFRTLDGGLTWASVQSGLNAFSAQAILVYPNPVPPVQPTLALGQINMATALELGEISMATVLNT